MNLKDAYIGLEAYFSPRIIGEVNDQYVKIAKIKGEDIPWHNHENEDELFYIIEGSLLMEIENEPSFTMQKDVVIYPRPHWIYPAIKILTQ